jgi:hypothetical protein
LNVGLTPGRVLGVNRTGTSGAADVDGERVVDLRQRLGRKLDVDDVAGDLNDLSGRQRRAGRRRLGRGGGHGHASF